MIRRLIIFLKSIRALESTLMIGFPLIGTFFALPDLSWDSGAKIARFLLPTYGLVIFVYALNSWGGVESDRRNRRLDAHPVLTGEITPRQLLFVATAGLIVAFTFYLLWLPRCFPLALAIACTWTIYSHPQIMAKSKPVYGSLIHFVGGVLQVLLGWATLAPLSGQALALAIYFSGVFAAGHMNHEVKDHDADKAAGLRTNAVIFGPDRMIRVALGLFFLSGVYLLCISGYGIVPWSLTWPFLVVVPIHALAHFIILTPSSPTYSIAYQKTYRLLYATAGAIVIVTQIARLWGS